MFSLLIPTPQNQKMKTRFQGQRRQSNSTSEVKASRVSKRLLGHVAPEVSGLVPLSDVKRLKRGLEPITSKASKAEWVVLEKVSKIQENADLSSKVRGESEETTASMAIPGEQDETENLTIERESDAFDSETDDCMLKNDLNGVSDRQSVKIAGQTELRLRFMAEKNRQLQLQIKLEEQRTLQKRIQADVLIKKEEAAERRLQLQLALERQKREAKEHSTALQERLLRQKGEQQTKLLEARSRSKVTSYRNMSEEKARLQEEQREKRLGLIRRSAGSPSLYASCGQFAARQMIHSFRQYAGSTPSPDPNSQVSPDENEGMKVGEPLKKKKKKKKKKKIAPKDVNLNN